MSKLVVAIIGRPNVGKSTLFNKLLGQRVSIVDNKAGVTRDRIYGECEWRGKPFILIDTGGIETNPSNEVALHIKSQAEIAINSADVIILVTDLTSGPLSSDIQVVDILRKSSKPTVLCVNKCDNIGKESLDLFEFYNLGIGDPIAVSSIHGHGTGDLLDAVFDSITWDNISTISEDISNEITKVAIIGKPNVGKSSLINKLLGEERCIVSNVAGTTRDSIDNLIHNKFGEYIFIDTAGLRKRSKIYSDIEKYSVLRAKLAIERADVCVLMIDASEGLSEQDTKIAALAHDAGKAVVIAVNKWDAVNKDTNTMKIFKKNISNTFAFMPYAEVVFISAKTGQRLDSLFKAINLSSKSSIKRISTGVLNEVLIDIISRVQPPSDRGKRLKIYYMTQVSIKPPTFVCFVNSKALFHFSYKRYVENRLREIFDFKGTVIRIIIKEKVTKGSQT